MYPHIPQLSVGLLLFLWGPCMEYESPSVNISLSSSYLSVKLDSQTRLLW